MAHSGLLIIFPVVFKFENSVIDHFMLAKVICGSRLVALMVECVKISILENFRFRLSTG
jgi:hypothetical protein